MFADRVAEVLGPLVAERDPEAYAYVQHVLRPAEAAARRQVSAARLRAVTREYASLVALLALPSDDQRALLEALRPPRRVRVCLDLIGGKLEAARAAKREALDGEYREALKKELFGLLGE